MSDIDISGIERLRKADFPLNEEYELPLDDLFSKYDELEASIIACRKMRRSLIKANENLRNDIELLSEQHDKDMNRSEYIRNQQLQMIQRLEEELKLAVGLINDLDAHEGAEGWSAYLLTDINKWLERNESRGTGGITTRVPTQSRS